MMSPYGPSRLEKGSLFSCSRQNMMTGRVNTKVFPEPVKAMPIISRPERLPEKRGGGEPRGYRRDQASRPKQGEGARCHQGTGPVLHRPVGWREGEQLLGRGESTHIVGMPWIWMGVGCWIPFFFRPLRIAVREHTHTLTTQRYSSVFPFNSLLSSSPLSSSQVTQPLL